MSDVNQELQGFFRKWHWLAWSLSFYGSTFPFVVSSWIRSAIEGCPFLLHETFFVGRCRTLLTTISLHANPQAYSLYASPQESPMRHNPFQSKLQSKRLIPTQNSTSFQNSQLLISRSRPKCGPEVHFLLQRIPSCTGIHSPLGIEKITSLPNSIKLIPFRC